MVRSLTASAVLTFLTLLAVDLPAEAAKGGLHVAPSSSGKKDLYIVLMKEAPVAKYNGETRGYAATKPTKGQRLRKSDPSVSRYADYLRSKQDATIQSLGARKIYNYAYALNGFSAELTEAQANALKSRTDVLSVSKNEIRKLDTVTTPAFLGLDQSNGIWNYLGGPRNAGRGVIIGIIDSGIWPEHPSFAGKKHGYVPDFNGVCQAGEAFPASTCNDKIIGARYYSAGFGGDVQIKATFPYEFASPRAADGHGVHTASTAAGNYRVPASVTEGDETYQLGKISGMAPGAAVAVYKACWGFSDDPAGGCSSVDTSAAIDDAVADGVDVINFSISGSSTSLIDAVEFAFLVAADAGVFVAASAGNSGPTVSTVAHNGPWVMTVAAGTHDRKYVSSVTLGNGASYPGVSLSTNGVPSSPLVLSSDAVLAGQDPAEAALCFPGTLDPAKVTGKVVICNRGVNDRVEKSQVVGDAGGVGMILTNVTPNSLNADIHTVPTVHVDDISGAAIKAYVASTTTPTAVLAPGTRITGPSVPAPDVASFSSRGPALAGSGDLLKPDIMAPGVDVLAAISPIESGRLYDFLSGTSMASPHIAGIAALIKDKHPDWSPAEIKSALMTTAGTRRNNGSPIQDQATSAAATALDYGAGQVRPNKAIDPGLVYDAGTKDWLAYLCGIRQACFTGIPAIDPSDLNYPSIAIGALAGSQTITRTVTNVSGHYSVYAADVQAPTGIKVSVNPRFFVIGPGKTKTYTVTFTNKDATLNTYALGSLTWTDGNHNVRSPLAVRPVALAAPAQVSSTGAPTSYTVGFGYSGPFTATPRGLVPATTYVDNVVDDPSNDIGTALSTGVGVKFYEVSIPAGTTYARFSLFSAFTDGAGDDLDLYVFNPAGNQVAASGNGGSDEEANLVNPAAGTYTVVVHGWEAEGGDSNYTLFQWLLGSADAGNMTITAPATATLGGTGTINLSFSGLTAGTKYLGSVSYSGAPSMPNPTIVRVDP
jgi:subtilisin family serine protease